MASLEQGWVKINETHRRVELLGLLEEIIKNIHRLKDLDIMSVRS